MIIIETGKYLTVSGETAIIETKQWLPLPMWRGRINQTNQQTAWYINGKEISDHVAWNLIERIEDKQ